MCAVEQRLAGIPADLVPDVRGQRLGDDHRAPERQQRALETGQPRGVPLGRAHDPVGAHAPRRRLDLALPDTERARPLVDGRPAPFDRVGEAANETCGMHPRAVRGEARAERIGDADALPQLVGLEQPQVVLAEPPLALGVDVRPQADELGRVLRDVEGSAAHEIGLDALLRRTPARPPPACRSPHVRVAPRHRAREGAHSARGSPVAVPDSQPPLRPDAPKPACSASSTATRSPGSASLR